MNSSVFGTFCQEFMEFTASLVNSKPYIPSPFLFLSISIFPFCQSTTAAAYFPISHSQSDFSKLTFFFHSTSLLLLPTTFTPPLLTWVRLPSFSMPLSFLHLLSLKQTMAATILPFKVDGISWVKEVELGKA